MNWLQLQVYFEHAFPVGLQYGGGKVIRPGEALETAEEKASKEARTRQLLAAYKKKVGLNIDPKLKSECQKVQFILSLLITSVKHRRKFTILSLALEVYCIAFFLIDSALIHRY